MAYCHLKKFREKGANRVKMASFRHVEPSGFTSITQVSTTSTTKLVVLLSLFSSTAIAKLVLLPQPGW